jgi:hypothetical protein
MKASLVGAITALVALGIAAPATEAQTTVSSTPAPIFAAQQLDQLVAPVALYPDELLGQILMAATYPLEVVEAQRWLQDPNNRTLTGDALATALAQQDWDPSVKALVPFPQVLQMMNDRLDWMQKLGDAFLSQQADVMDAVQRLRRQAQASGTLVSTPQQVVTSDGQTIAIEPANPNLVYPPYYDPRAVYGSWPDPDYPPYYFPPPPDYVYGPSLFFGFGIAVIPTFWGWDHMDWRRRDVRIDVDRFDGVNRQEDERLHRPPVTQDTWHHDPSHRRGVAYRDPAARTRFTPQVPGSGTPDARRSYRGYDNATRGAGPGQQHPVQPQQQVQRRSATVATPTPAPSPLPQQQQQQQFQRRGSTGGTPPAIQPPAQQTRLPTVAHPPSTPAVVQRPVQNRMPVVMRPPPTPPPAFAVDRGQDVRIQSNRGQQSLQSLAPRAGPVVAAPAPHPAPQPARPSGGGGGAQHGGNAPGARGAR